METKEKQAGPRLVEYAPDKARQLDELPDDRLRSAMATLTKLSEHAGRDPGWPWSEYACDVEDDETQDILCLWVCGLARVATVFDRATDRAVMFLARPK
jgi:hypothetical protein